MRASFVCIGSACALAALAPSVARANPRVLPMTYTAETLPAGSLELEPIVDYTPVKAIDAATGDIQWYGASQLQLELEYGITDRLELGLYITTALRSPDFADTPVLSAGNGLKQRLRYRISDPATWPIGLAVYGEISENEREIELEGKLILSARLGAGLRVVANLWAEREIYFEGRQEWVLNPTAGLTWEITPKIQPGLEYWMRAEYPDESGTRTFNLGPHHYVGPVVLVDFGKLWFSTGLYFRVSDVGHELVPGEAYGPIWARMIIGISL